MILVTGSMLVARTHDNDIVLPSVLVPSTSRPTGARTRRAIIMHLALINAKTQFYNAHIREKVLLSIYSLIVNFIGVVKI